MCRHPIRSPRHSPRPDEHKPSTPHASTPLRLYMTGQPSTSENTVRSSGRVTGESGTRSPPPTPLERVRVLRTTTAVLRRVALSGRSSGRCNGSSLCPARSTDGAARVPPSRRTCWRGDSDQFPDALRVTLSRSSSARMQEDPGAPAFTIRIPVAGSSYPCGRCATF